MTATQPTTRHLVGRSEDVPEGGRHVVDVAGTTIGVFRFKGRLYAYENVCPHQGGPVCQGRLVPRVAEVLDEGKRTILRNQAAETVVEAKYENASPDFLRLCALISSARDDQPLVDAVLKLYELSQAYPFPERWLNSLCDEFEAERPIEETPWGRLLDRCLGMLAEEPELEAKYAPTFLDDRAMLSSLLETAEGGEWDELCRRYAAAAFGKMGTAPRGYASYTKEACGVIRKKYKADFEKLGEFLTISAEEHAADVAALAPVVRELIGTVNDFAAEFARLKLEENSADFSDTLHFALKLLVRETTDGYERTPLAAALSENYAEILVDEYQDVNKAQDMIFSALSRDESNLFMVGDVKQSIYRFRQAMPEIFLARRDRYAEYEGGSYRKGHSGQEFQKPQRSDRHCQLHLLRRHEPRGGRA